MLAILSFSQHSNIDSPSCRMNSSFAYVANLENLAKSAERDLPKKSRLDLPATADSPAVIDGVGISLNDLGKAYKATIKDLTSDLTALSHGIKTPFNLRKMAASDVDSTETQAKGWSPFPDLSNDLWVHLGTLEGASGHHYLLSPTSWTISHVFDLG